MEIKIEKRSLDGKYEYIPYLFVPTTDGLIPNREQPDEHKIVCTIKTASREQRENYFRISTKSSKKQEQEMFYRSCYKEAITNHIIKITGLESVEINDGKTLYGKHHISDTLDELMGELFNEVCRFNKEDNTLGE